MPTRAHPPVTLYIRDRWLIGGRLLNGLNEPFNLTNKTVEWCLYDKGAFNRLINTTEVTVQIDDAVAGLLRVNVPEVVTGRLMPGRYEDAIRVTGLMDDPETFWTGIIYVGRTGFASMANMSTVMLGGSGSFVANATVV